MRFTISASDILVKVVGPPEHSFSWPAVRTAAPLSRNSPARVLAADGVLTLAWARVEIRREFSATLAEVREAILAVAIRRVFMVLLLGLLTLFKELCISV